MKLKNTMKSSKNLMTGLTLLVFSLTVGCASGPQTKDVSGTDWINNPTESTVTYECFEGFYYRVHRSTFEEKLVAVKMMFGIVNDNGEHMRCLYVERGEQI